MGAEHQQLGLQHGLVAQRQVHGHLVAVEVGVERGTCQRVQLDCLTLDHARLERLDTQTVKCRGTVQKHRMALHHMLQDIPYHRLLAVYYLLGRLHGLDDAALYELADDERFVQLGGHQLGDTALVHLQLGADHDHGTCRIVHTLTQQVLTETSLLTLQRVGQRFERTVYVALDGRRLAAVVQQRVHRLLQQTLLVAQNHLGSLYLDESLQTVVTYDDAAVQVVEVGSCEAAAVQRHQGTQFRRNHRHGLQNHPLGAVLAHGVQE